MSPVNKSKGYSCKYFGGQGTILAAIGFACWTLLVGSALKVTATETFGHGQITWENRQIDVHPKIADMNAAVVFKFSNVGDQPLTLGSVKADCSCTVVSAQKKVYAAGESGEIAVKYNIGNRVGLHQAQVIVESDDPTQPVSQLTLRVFIPELVRISPSVVEWKYGDPSQSKKVTIRVVHTEPIRIIGVTSTHDQIWGQLHTVTVGREYELTITPASTRELAKATLRLESDYPQDRPRIFYVYAAVKPKPDSGGTP